MPHSDDELRKWCRSNWDRLPELIRNDCIAELEASIPHATIVTWKKFGYEGGLFHLIQGMEIRNLLRKQLTDEELPGIKHPQLSVLVKCWDDFYTGAIDELLERYNEDGTKK